MATVTDFGYVAVLLALVVAIYTAVAAVLGVREGFPELLRSARRGVYAVFALVTLAEAVIVYSLVSFDFGSQYVARYVSRDMELPYIVSAMYAGNDGSLLFWAWILSILAALAVWRTRKDRVFAPYMSATTMAIAGFFLALVTLVANPFQRLASPVSDGTGMNPLLENVGMLIHPPTLFLGYVGLAIPFAFGIAALVTGRLGDEWINRSRMWALFAWLMLGIGNVLGGQWAYVELGWGGYWAWDPVENASLMPWIIITAYLHANVIRRRRDMFKAWSIVLVVVAFLLSVFGTFITRTGILNSVHSFGDSSLGPFFAVFIGAFTLGSLGLIVYRWPELQGEDEIQSFWSRENWVFIGNLILVGITVAVFFGTVFPAVSDIFVGRKIELTKDFFNQVNGPIILALVFTMGICPILAWRKTPTATMRAALLPPAVGGVVVAVALVAFGVRELVAAFALGVSAFVILVYVGDWFRGVRQRQRSRGINPFSAFGVMVWGNRPRYGAHIVHLAIAVMTIGVVSSTFFTSTVEGNLKVGEQLQVGPYAIRYEGMAQDGTPSRDIVSATVTLFKNGEMLDVLAPASTFHKSVEQPVSDVAIRSTLQEDVYVVLAGWTADGTATFKVIINPLVTWIWIGGALLLLGGLIAMWPETRPQEATVSDEAQEPVPGVA